MESLPLSLRVLTEQEIQERLYGRYLGRPHKTASSLPIPTESEWTGAEILSEELKRLRTELITLRQERERLIHDLARCQQRAPSSENPSLPPLKRLTRWASLGVLAILLALPLRIKLLQAIPAPTEAASYTVQVGVYHVKPMAEKAMELLKELGYPAFLVRTYRLNGRTSYRIYVGQFVTREEADLERRRISADSRFFDAFVRIR